MYTYLFGKMDLKNVETKWGYHISFIIVIDLIRLHKN